MIFRKSTARLLGLTALVAWVLGAAALPALASDKKGIGLYELDRGDRINALHADWYYTWRSVPNPTVRHTEFVPMVWGGWRWDSDLKAVKAMQGRRPIRQLLVDNEPDHTDQSNMSVDSAISKWSQLPAAQSISTPAGASPLGPWMAQFMKSAAQQNLKMNFMAVHIYTAPDVQDFLHTLDATHARYHLPIWITEFGVADWGANAQKPNRYSDEQVQAFMAQLLPELEKRDFVVRYSWYGAGPQKPQSALWSSRLFDTDGSLTPLGCFYRNFSWPDNPTGAGSCSRVHVRP